MSAIVSITPCRALRRTHSAPARASATKSVVIVVETHHPTAIREHTSKMKATRRRDVNVTTGWATSDRAYSAAADVAVFRFPSLGANVGSLPS